MEKYFHQLKLMYPNLLELVEIMYSIMWMGTAPQSQSQLQEDEEY